MFHETKLQHCPVPALAILFGKTRVRSNITFLGTLFILFTPSQVRHRRQVDPLIVNFHPIFLAINLENCQCQTQWPGQTGGSCETKLCIFIKLLEHNVNLLLKLERFKQSTIGRKRVSTLRLSHLLLFSRILEFQTKDSI